MKGNGGDRIGGWLADLRCGHDGEAAARGLWERYHKDLIPLARARLRGDTRGPADEEDIVQRVLDGFCRGLAAGQFPNLSGHQDLWRLLVCLTAREASEHVQHERRQRRGGGRVVHASALDNPDAGTGSGLSNMAGREVSPEFAAGAMDECRRLFGLLGDESLVVVALLRMEGFTNAQIASSLDCSLRSVESKLQMIRKAWSGSMSEPPT